MKSKVMGLFGIVSGAVLSVSAVAPAGAASINTSMLECQAVNAPQAEIRHTENGVYTEGLVSTPRFITCSVPRSPVAAGSAGGTFYITGDNRDGMASTSCTLSVYDYLGNFVTSSSFNTPAAHYLQGFFFPTAQLGTWSYTSITCLMPEAARGNLESVVSWQ